MKYILKMAFRNIGRNRKRTFLSASAISIAVMIIVIMKGYIGGATDSMFDSLTKIDTGHIKIQHPEYHSKEDMMPLEHKIDGFDGNGYKQLIPILNSIQEIKIIAPRIKFGVLLSFNGKTQSAVGVGIEPKSEKLITSFDKIMISGNYLSNDENDKSIVIGCELADRLGIKVGDKITIVARTAFDSLKGITFTVSGLFRYGITNIDSRLFYIPIGTASKLLEMDNGISEIIIMIDKPENAEKIADKIINEFNEQRKNNLCTAYSVIPWQKQENLLSILRTVMPIYNAVYIGLLILASTVIINTTMMVIFERTKEIGTIGALGMASEQIVLLFTLESTIISAIGSFIGVILGGGFSLYFSIVGINVNKLTGNSKSFPLDIIYPRFGLFLLLGAFIFGIIVATIFAYIPARRSAKIEPAEALRSV